MPHDHKARSGSDNWHSFEEALLSIQNEHRSTPFNASLISDRMRQRRGRLSFGSLTELLRRAERSGWLSLSRERDNVFVRWLRMGQTHKPWGPKEPHTFPTCQDAAREWQAGRVACCRPGWGQIEPLPHARTLGEPSQQGGLEEWNPQHLLVEAESPARSRQGSCQRSMSPCESPKRCEAHLRVAMITPAEKPPRKQCSGCSGS